MKINWKLRLMNRTTLTALAAAFLSLGYILLGICGIVPGVTQSQAMDAVAAGLNILVLLGIVADPTTEGLADSERALRYTAPAAAEKARAADKTVSAPVDKS